MATVVLKTSGRRHAPYRVVWEPADPDDGFRYEALHYDAMGEPSWRPVNRNNLGELLDLLEAICQTVAESPGVAPLRVPQK